MLPIKSHKESRHKSFDYLGETLIGITDGLTVPFALATGLSGAFNNSHVVLIAGLVAIAAGGITMGFGGYLAAKTEEDYPEKRKAEYEEIKEAKDFFANIGLSPELQEKVAGEIAKDHNRWLAFYSKYESSVNKPGYRNSKKSGFMIGISYIIGGLIPVSPYFFMNLSMEALPYSAIVTIISMLVFGYFKSRISNTGAVWGAIRITTIGIIAAAAAYGVGKLFVS